VASAGKAEAVAEQLLAKGVRALAIKSDLADRAAAGPLVERVLADLGRLDILVNNAGIVIQGKRVDDPELDGGAYDRQWQVNVMGTIALNRAAAPRLSDGGRIVFIGSLLGSHLAFPGVADYAGTKTALAGYARGVARDLHPIRRIATLEEVAGTVCFLAGPHAGYITGSAINIAGGIGT
jgi:NAD(P)-dependent dehydrogenase (short-subunit alcohol dehydrogenase family)